MARGALWALISCGLCLALEATTSQPTRSSQHVTPDRLSRSSQAATRETSLSVAFERSTAASTWEDTTTAAPASSRNPESPPAPSLSQTSTSATPAAGSHETDQPGNTSTSATPAAGSHEPVTKQPGHADSTAASSSASPTSPGSATALHTTEAAPIPESPSLSQSPGLVAVICIFVIILLLATMVVVVKLCGRREPAFKKLDEVPMGKMTEDSPFARYPPK